MTLLDVKTQSRRKGEVTTAAQMNFPVVSLPEMDMERIQCFPLSS